jgi:hypothetical protein
MDNRQSFEPAPRGLSKRRSNAGEARAYPEPPARTGANFAGRFFFALLERLAICHAPHILSVECLAGETRYSPADAVPRMDEAGILTDLAV